MTKKESRWRNDQSSSESDKKNNNKNYLKVKIGTNEIKNIVRPELRWTYVKFLILCFQNITSVCYSPVIKRVSGHTLFFDHLHQLKNIINKISYYVCLQNSRDSFNFKRSRVTNRGGENNRSDTLAKMSKWIVHLRRRLVQFYKLFSHTCVVCVCGKKIK